MEVSVLTGQTIHLLGILTEALHTPHLHDRYLSIEAARYIRNNAKSMSSEFDFKKEGIINIRAHEVVCQSIKLLESINNKGLFESLAEGVFAGIKRLKDSGKGKDGVFEKAEDYLNPFDELFKPVKEDPCVLLIK